MRKNRTAVRKNITGKQDKAGRAAKENEYRDDGEVNGGGKTSATTTAVTTAAITQKNITPKNTAKKNTAKKNTATKNTTKKNTATKNTATRVNTAWAGRNRRGAAAFLHPSDGLIAAFFIPVIVLVVIFAQRGIFPFGQESFLRTDMYHQYALFFSEFHHKLRTGGSLLYSWDIGWE